MQALVVVHHHPASDFGAGAMAAITDAVFAKHAYADAWAEYGAEGGIDRHKARSACASGHSRAIGKKNRVGWADAMGEALKIKSRTSAFAAMTAKAISGIRMAQAAGAAWNSLQADCAA